MASSLPASNHESHERARTSLLGSRSFLLFWLACGISVLGDHLGMPAVIHQPGATDDEGRIRIQATAYAMLVIPFVLAGPLFGVLADLWSRRGFMIAASLLRMGLMLGLVALPSVFQSYGPIWSLTPLLICGAAASLSSPARSALLPAIVRKDQLVRSNALIIGLSVAAILIAAATGGRLAARFSGTTVLAAGAAAFVASAVLLSLVRPTARAASSAVPGTGSGFLVEGVRHLVNHRQVVQLTGVVLLLWLCAGIAWSAAPVLLWEIYDSPSLTSVSLLRASMGIGVLIGSLGLTSFGDALRCRTAVTWSLAGMTGSVAVLAASCLVPISPGSAHGLGVVAMLVGGVFGATIAATCIAMLQRAVPDRLRGRVFGLIDSIRMTGLLSAGAVLSIPRWTDAGRWIGWVLLALAVILAAVFAGALVAHLRRRHMPWTRQFWWSLNEFYCRWWFRLRREGPCTVPAGGPVIVVANHTCGIDPLLLIASTPHRLIGFLVAEEFTHIPIGGRLIRMIGCVPVRRDGHDAAGTRAALRHLRDGNVLGIFIEGGIPEPGEIREPKLGAAMLALHSGALIVPAHLSGTHYDENVGWSFLRRHWAVVRFGKPIDLSRYWIPSGDKEALRKVSIKLLEQIRTLAPEGESQDDMDLDEGL